VAFGSSAATSCASNFEPQHPRSGQQNAVHGNEQSVDVIDGQRMQQHVALGEAPLADERQRVRREIAVREHRALGPARGAGRVEQRREVVGRASDRGELGRQVVCGCEQRAAIGIEGEERGVGRKRGDLLACVRAGDDHLGLRVAEKIAELAFPVRGVERQVDQPRAQTREVEGEHRGVLVRLHRDAIARRAAGSHQRMRDARRIRREVAVAHDLAAGDQQHRLLAVLREMALEQRVEVGVHRVDGEGLGARRARSRAPEEVAMLVRITTPFIIPY